LSTQTFIKLDSLAADFTDRLFTDLTVDGSPAAAAETIIATVTVASVPRAEMGVLLFCTAAFTAGTNGTGANLRIRRTNAAGAIIVASGAVTVVATQLYSPTVLAFDPLGVAQNQVYVATLQITAGSAPSTVSAVTFAALVV